MWLLNLQFRQWLTVARELGAEEPDEVQQGQVQGPAPEEE